ncbi:GlxA family transcriptional regulator [Benzoatithermus flavus]|uniref:GlxA family transcriptional regulator n=1 Tax=Benzoatithermus flavus TaxID=3108223 RepID=A0ABU8XP74_9PROT
MSGGGGRQGRKVDLATLRRFVFLTLPNYSMIACSNALEACRMANYVAGRRLYAWQVATLDGRPSVASNGLSLQPTVALAEAGPADAVFVCGGVDVRQSVGRPLEKALRRLAQDGIVLGAICTGSFVLAEAGLLDGYRCAIHWENLAAIREEFPLTSFVEDLFVVDGDRLTCTGGVAPLDMMLFLIEARLGRDLAARVSDQFVLERIRRADDPQHIPLRARIGPGHLAVTRVARAMEKNIERPLAIAVLAARVGMSERQIERLFRQHVGMKPSEYYMTIRLDRARELLRLSDLSITDVAVATGFTSPSHFSTAYRRRFGHAPREERKTSPPDLPMGAA